MTLTETQTKQAQDLIEQYGFCSLETQEELAKAGFFEKVKALSYIAIAKTSGIPISVLYIEDAGWAQENEHYAFIPMPQMGEVWKRLPQTLWSYSLNINKGRICYVCSEDGLLLMLKNEELVYVDVQNGNPTEAMCRLWLLLHKENLL